MKQTLIILTIAIAAMSCGGGSNGGNNNPQPNNKKYYDVPNWGQDAMLYGAIVETNTTPAGTDSMYSYMDGKVLKIEYQNKKYSVKAYDPLQSSPTDPNSMLFFVDILDNSNNVVAGGFAAPPKYMNSGQWVKNLKHIIIGDSAKAPFNKYVINGGIYADPNSL